LFELNYDEVLKKLREYAEKAVAMGAEAVILIGSLARGDYTAFSDADVIVIADDVPERPMDRPVKFMDPTLPLDVDVRVYTTVEFFRMAVERRKIIEEVVSCGKLLAGNAALMDRIRKLMDES